MNIDKKLIEELKTQLSLINYDRNKTLSEQNFNSQNLLTELDWLADKAKSVGKKIGSAVDSITGPTDNASAKIYASLNSNPSAVNIADVLKQSNAVNDRECWAQFAFNKIKNEEVYYQVGYELRSDPYAYVQSFTSTNTNPCGMKNVNTVDSKWKSLGSIRYPKTYMQRYPTSENIVRVLQNAKGGGIFQNDLEYWVESAIMAIKDKEQWFEVTKLLGSDPLVYASETIGYNTAGTVIGKKAEEFKVKNYPYSILKNKPTEQIIAKVIGESMGVATVDKPAWAEAAFNAILEESKGSPGKLYKDICKTLGQDAYKYVEYYIGSEGMKTKYNEGKFISSNYKTLYECYQEIKTKAKGGQMFYDYTLASDGMYSILDSGSATPNYVADVIFGSRAVSYETEESGFSSVGLFGSFDNDCEACVVAAYTAIKNKPFYDQVTSILKTNYKELVSIKSIEDWVESFMSLDTVYHNGKSVATELNRINNSVTNSLQKDSSDKIQIAINDVTEKGFGQLTNFDDCVTANQVYYKAYLYGIKTITDKIHAMRKNTYAVDKYSELRLSKAPPFLGVLSFLPTAKYIGYPSCLEVNSIQIKGSRKQDLDNKIQLTSSSYSVSEGLAEDALSNIMSYIDDKDLEYIDKNDPNAGNLSIENTYILQDFVDSWSKFESQYKYHFSTASTQEDELFPQGPKKFFEYWFNVDEYGEALQNGTLVGPKIFCQANKLKSEGNLKTGVDALLEETKDVLHIVLPIASLCAMVFGQGWIRVVCSLVLESLDAGVYQYVDEDPYMAGLTLVFAFAGVGDEVFISLMKGQKAADICYKIHQWRLGKEALDEVSFQVLRYSMKNLPKLKSLALESLYVSMFKTLFNAATEQGAKTYIKVLAKLVNAGIISRNVFTKLGLIIGGSFVTWDWIASNVYGMCNEFKISEALKYSNDSPDAHYWVTNKFIQMSPLLQPFSSKCPDSSQAKSTQISLAKDTKDQLMLYFDAAIQKNFVLNLENPIYQLLPLIQELYRFKGVDKTFNPSGIKHMKFDFSKDSWLSKIIPESTDCGGIIGVLQIEPSEKNKKTGPYSVAIHFVSTDYPELNFFKQGEKVTIQNTSFDGTYDIKKVHTKNQKIVALTINIPYKPIYPKGLNYDSNFKNRGFVKKYNRLACLPDIQSKKINFTDIFDENMKQATINYQMQNKIYPFNGEIGKETWLSLKKDFDQNFNYLMNQVAKKDMLKYVISKNDIEKIESKYIKESPEAKLLADPVKTQQEIDKMMKDRNAMKNDLDNVQKGVESLQKGTEAMKNALDLKSEQMMESFKKKIEEMKNKGLDNQ